MSGLIKSPAPNKRPNNLCTTIIMVYDPLRPSPRNNRPRLHTKVHSKQSLVLWLAITKEVIRPQVPLRPPCYDFSPLAEPRFDVA
jgi:hypothetical protein